MLAVPNVTNLDVAFGGIAHMPKYEDIPADFKSIKNPYVRAVSSWFFSGASRIENGISVDGKNFIILADGREIIVARSFEEARKIDNLFQDINR